MTKEVGDYVRRGELLARVESSESLQTYPVYSTVSGVVAERPGNPGNITGDQPLYVITDPAATTVVFNIFPKDLGIVRPGMRVEVAVAGRACRRRGHARRVSARGQCRGGYGPDPSFHPQPGRVDQAGHDHAR